VKFKCVINNTFNSLKPNPSPVTTDGQSVRPSWCRAAFDAESRLDI
jgi:hypothetical protein